MLYHLSLLGVTTKMGRWELHYSCIVKLTDKPCFSWGYKTSSKMLYGLQSEFTNLMGLELCRSRVAKQLVWPFVTMETSIRLALGQTVNLDIKILCMKSWQSFVWFVNIWETDSVRQSWRLMQLEAVIAEKRSKREGPCVWVYTNHFLAFLIFIS